MHIMDTPGRGKVVPVRYSEKPLDMSSPEKQLNKPTLALSVPQSIPMTNELLRLMPLVMKPFDIRESSEVA